MLLILILGVLVGQGVSAQSIEEVTVTATKRGAQLLQDVPFSIQALSGEKLESVGANDFNDFFRRIPGLSVLDQGPGDKRIIIRGVNATGAGTVGLYLDDVIITGENAQDGGGRQPDIKLFDINRVEVLKGPQGTTFGSSSLAGTIRYITNQPKLTEKELKVRGTVRDIKGADIGGQVEVAGNLPLIDDKLAIRVSGLYLKNDGFIDNNFGKGVNSDETLAGRVSLLYSPTDNLNFTLMAMRQDVYTRGPAFFNRVDGSGAALPEFTQSDLSSNPFTDKITLFNAKLEYTNDYGTFTGTASRLKRDTVFNRDASLAVGPFSVITQPKNRGVNSFELRFASAWNLPVQILLGVFEQNEHRFFQSRIFPSDPVTGKFTEVKNFSLDRNVDTNIDTLAFFGEVSFDIIDSLTFTGGFRWFNIDVGEIATAVQGFSGAAGAGTGPDLASSQTSVIGKANLSYHFTDDIMAYAQWSQGFRSGGTNDQTAAEIAMVTIPQGFGSDSLDNYETGIKSSWLDDRIVANGAFFYIDWADIQIQDQAQDPNNPAVFFPFRANGGAADIFGAELDITVRPVEGLEVGLAASYTDAALSEDNPIPSSGLKGDTIPYIPETTFSLTGQYIRPLPFRNYNGFVGLDVTYVDNRTTELRPNNPLNLDLKSYTLVNLRTGLKSEDWSATLAVNNVFDDDTVIDVFRIIPGLTPDGFIPQMRRTITFNISKSFF